MKHWHHYLGSEDVPERSLEPPDEPEEYDPAQAEEYDEEPNEQA